MEEIEPGLFQRIFTWFGGRKEVPESRTSGRRPYFHSMTGGLPANEELLLGLFHGTYPGLEKAAPLARAPINTPVNMIGMPTPVSKDSKTQNKLNEIRRMMSQEIKLNNKLFGLIGTSWVYPKWDSKNQNGLVWKLLKDSHVVDVLIDINTEMIYGVITDEQISITTGENKIETIRRKVRYTSSQINVEYCGALAGITKDYSAKNVAQTTPIMFAHDFDDMASRGHSLVEPCLCDFKDYHDIDTRVSETLSRFRVKQLQKVREGTGFADWKHNQGLNTDEDFANYDIAEQDLLILVGDKEDTKYEYLPEGATSAAEKALDRLAWKIICGTETPEIFFGRAVSGNLGSYAEQMNMMFTKVQGLREELEYPYKELFKASLILCGIAESTKYNLDFDMGWNKLSALSENEKADILQKFCSSVAVAAKAGALGIHQLYQLWKNYYPDLDYGTEDKFKAELVKMGNLQQFMLMDYASGESVLTAAGGEKEAIDRTVK